MNEGNEQWISRRAGERGPTIFGAPIPMLGGVQIPERIVLRGAAVNFFGVDEPEFKSDDQTKADRKSSTRSYFLHSGER